MSAVTQAQAPSDRLGRALDVSLHRQELGNELLLDALTRAVAPERAAGFYEKSSR